MTRLWWCALFALLSASAHGLDPDANRDMMELVQSKGYVIEKHFARTDDGYILGMFRMPPSAATNGKVVLLQHGNLDSSFDYVANGPQKSLGFILADAGYDVWFGNDRGNTYSRNHTSLKVSDTKFWNFTWGDMARFDLPAEIDYVLAVSGAKTLTYLGHSQGTSVAFAGLALNQTLASKVDLYIAMAPVVFAYYVKPQLRVGNETLVRLLAKVPVSAVEMLLGHHDFLPQNALAKYMCYKFPSFCTELMVLAVGPSTHWNSSRLPVYLSQLPAGTSVKDIGHFVQGAREEKSFGEFNYGKKGNSARYGRDTPPPYDLSSITVPIVLATGGNDDIADPEDVKNLITSLAPGVLKKRVHMEDYGHMDFVWAMNAAEVLYPQLLSAMNTFTSQGPRTSTSYMVV